KTKRGNLRNHHPIINIRPATNPFPLFCNPLRRFPSILSTYPISFYFIHLSYSSFCSHTYKHTCTHITCTHTHTHAHHMHTHTHTRTSHAHTHTNTCTGVQAYINVADVYSRRSFRILAQ
ncbi:hypothetical protein LOAG_01457, partial [Loa loa]